MSPPLVDPAGLGSATLIPIAFAEAEDLPGMRHGTGITIVAWMLRFGFLLAPPVVGVIADNVGLRAGLWIVPVAGVVVVLWAGAVKGRRPQTSRAAGLAPSLFNVARANVE